jgi:uncharacterized protein YPO0396
VVDPTPTLRHLLDRQATALIGMRQRARERVDMQNLERMLARQQVALQQLHETQQDLQQGQQGLQAAQRQLLHGIDGLMQRGAWSRLRRIFGRKANR